MVSSSQQFNLSPGDLGFLFESMPFGVIFQKAGGVIFAANTAAQKILGVPLEQLRGRTPDDPRWQAVHEDGTPLRGDDHPAMQALRSGQAVRDVVIGGLNPETGALTWIKCCSVPQFAQPGEPPTQVMTTFEDITAWKKAQDDLEVREKTLQLFVTYAPASIAMFDREMRYLAVSSRYLSDYRIHDSNILGKSHYEVFPEIPERWKEIHRRCLAGAVEMAPDDEFPRGDGTIDWVRWEIHPWYQDENTIGGILLFSEVVTEHKRMVLELRQSQENFIRVFDQAPISMAIMRRQDGKVLRINWACSDLTGLLPAEVVGKPSSEIYLYHNPADRPLLLNELQEHGVIKNHELQIQLKSGVVRSIIFNAGIVQFSGEDCLLTTMQDITGQKQFEQGLKDARDFQQMMFQLGPIAKMILDLDTRIILDINSAAEIMFGCSRKTVIGSPVDQLDYFVDPAERQRAQEILIHRGKISDFEFEYKSCTGATGWALEYGEIIRQAGRTYVLTEYLDITERKRAENEIARLLERLDLATSSAEMGIWDWDIVHNHLVWDDQMHRLYGVQKDRFTNRVEDWVSTMHPEDREPILELCMQAVRGEREYDTEFRVIWPDGSLHWLKANGVVFRDSAGAPQRMVGVNYEITQRKQAEEEIRQLNTELELRVARRTAQLESANKELESFSYSVSHDLRAPLRRIDGYSQALADDYQKYLDETGLHYIDRVRQEAQRMGTLVDDMLRLAHLQRAEIQWGEVNLSELAHTIALQTMDTQPERQIRWSIQPGLSVRGDAHLLEIVLNNLLLNAVKFTGSQASARIEFGSTQVNQKTAYFVRDNGVGFNMAYAKNLFAPFRRLHQQTEFPGNGVGLATVQRIIQRHGGSIWAESSPGAGATFYFMLGEEKP